jgi:hypothetical protein
MVAVEEADAALNAFCDEVVGAESTTMAAPTWTISALVDAYVSDRARVGKAKTTLESYEDVGRRLDDTIASGSLTT